MAGMGAFDWADPFLLDDQLEDDERMLRDSARLCRGRRMTMALVPSSSR